MEEPLAPPGNPLRPRSLFYACLGFGALVLLLASDAHFVLSVPLGFLAALVSALGVLDFAGCFDGEPQPGRPSIALRELRPRLLEAGATALLWVLVLRLAVQGALPQHALVAPLAVTATSAAVLLAWGRVALAWQPQGQLRQRAGFWLLLVGLLLYVPFAGSYSLLDPWETHYGEVAREMLARDDWLSFWWAQEGWFWSKPPLDFWLQGLSFALLGVDFRPGQMLAGAAHGRLPQPEWAARLPIALVSLLAVYLLYRFVAAAAGKRAGLLAGLLLLCAPYWSLLAHQSMTDMPYVAPLTAALSCFGLALLTGAEERVGALELTAFGRRLELSLFHLLFGAVLLMALPQLAYLLTRHLTLQVAAPPYGFRWHADEFFSGSGMGNCGLPGNDVCRRGSPSSPYFQPALGLAVFGAALGYLLWLNRGERRKKRLLYIAAWLFTALAALAKGAPGLVLPLLIASAVLFVRGRWQELLRAEVASLGLVIAAVCMPWYVQEYMRHGDGFTDRLLFHDMYKRAFVHVHDTNAGTDVSLRYYVWQLGYGLFPWSGLALGGLGLALERGSSADERQRDLGALVTIWLVLSFGLFTLSLTKFHHYALPCAPPLAVSAALLLDRGWRREPSSSEGGSVVVLAWVAALVTLLIARDLSTSWSGDVPASARLLHLVTYNYRRAWPASLDFEWTFGAFGVAFAAALGAFAFPRLRRYAVALCGAVAVGFCAFTLWVYLPALAPHYGQRELFLAYYRARGGESEPVVAYQMNWKGENFYTGNRIPAFVTTGAKFEKWLEAQRKAGAKVLFFVAEHGRTSTLKAELGDRYRVTQLTDKQLNNKFCLLKAEAAPQR
ncbi:MAG: glycosyltransferase family 39 protein [Myxococcales bacterium]|nr:MAG: glycosyltransferase family 39 protein [Myxococcales bacterium]